MTRLASLCLLLLALASPAFAEPPDDGPPPMEEEMKSRLRMMRMYALTEALELDEDTAARLFPYLRAGDEAMDQVHDKLRAERRALRDLAGKADLKDKDIDVHIAAIGALEEQMAALRAEQVDGLRDILSAEQRLRFVLTRAKVERELRRVLRERHREGRRDRGGRGDRGERGDRGDRGERMERLQRDFDGQR